MLFCVWLHASSGNSFTTLLATVNPGAAHFEETVNTLQVNTAGRRSQSSQ
jgi:hypothetical protein